MSKTRIFVLSMQNGKRAVPVIPHSAGWGWLPSNLCCGLSRILLAPIINWLALWFSYFEQVIHLQVCVRVFSRAVVVDAKPNQDIWHVLDFALEAALIVTGAYLLSTKILTAVGWAAIRYGGSDEAVSSRVCSYVHARFRWGPFGGHFCNA